MYLSNFIQITMEINILRSKTILKKKHNNFKVRNFSPIDFREYLFSLKIIDFEIK
jgi:hypothetical protein